MMREPMDVFAFAQEILRALRTGVLVTTQAGDRRDTMTLGWGSLGVEWGVPVFTAFVRESRYTRELLDENPEFTVSIPRGGCDPEILRLCGSRSGRDVDKFAALGLTTAAPEAVAPPGIRQLPLTLECRVLCRQRQEAELLPPAVLEKSYPARDGRRDLHIAYSGEIVAAYLLK